MPTDESNDLLTPAQASALLNVDSSKLATWRFRRIGPPFITLAPRTPRYSRKAVLAWLASRSIEVKP